MAGILGSAPHPITIGAVVDNMSPAIADYDPVIFDPPAASDVISKQDYGIIGRQTNFTINNTGLLGDILHSFFYDFYFRIHVTPTAIDLQTIASSQTRELTVWNAWPYTESNLDSVSTTDLESSIIITGQATPYFMAPLEVLTYELSIDAIGPPFVDTEVIFDFLGIPDPQPVPITGLRAIKFDLVPETPVEEDWIFLTDSLISVDGTEQQISLRGEVPRVQMGIKVIIEDIDLIREFYAAFMNSVNRFWLPEYQYMASITQESLEDDAVIYFDESRTDIRDGEYALVKTKLNSELVQILEINGDGTATLGAPLTFDVPVGSIICPGSPCVLQDSQSLQRYAVDDGAQFSITALFTRQRTVLTRQGSSVSLTMFNSLPVLDRRPTVDNFVNYTVDTGQELVDNKIGYFDIITNWAYSKIGGDRTYKIRRFAEPEEMDYWKTFLSFARGKSRLFYAATYRKDLELTASPSDGASSYTVKGKYYAEKLFLIPTHKCIEIETDSGIHRTEIDSATVVGNNTAIALNTSVPSGAGWQVVNRISFLLPVRLSSDSVNLKHNHLDTYITIKLRAS